MTKTALEYFYPEIEVGGFSHVSSTVDLYNRINALLTPDMTVMDFGAGRGQSAEIDSAYVRELMRIKGKVSKFIGVDVDPVVLENPLVDEATVIKPDEPLPFPDRSVDLIICDWVLEHISDPAFMLREVHRILKPGGWLCARTPNRWGYVALGATLIPSGLHGFIMKIVQPHRKEMDIFPKFYRMNSFGSIDKLFRQAGFASYIYSLNSEPAYAGNMRMAWRVFFLLFRITPASFQAFLHVFAKKAS